MISAGLIRRVTESPGLYILIPSFFSTTFRVWPAAWIDDGRPEGPRVLLGYNAPIDGEPEAAFESLDAYARAVQARAADTGDAAAITYVLNMNTHKMHYPDCSSVSQIRDTNRKDFSGTREEAIAMGYVPCKRCNP